MGNVAWHETRGFELRLNRADLGHPDIPGLYDEITAPIGKRDREMLKCLKCHETGTCGSISAGKGPWVTIRRARIGGKVVLVPAHLPETHTATAEESALHKAVNNRIATVASGCTGYSVEMEAWSADRKTRADVLVTANGREYDWETQITPIRGEYARQRDRKARRSGRLPMWIVASAEASLIHRVDWARIDKLNHNDIDRGKILRVMTGFQRLQVWRCTNRQPFACPEARGVLYCGREHVDLKNPMVCHPAEPPIVLDELVVAIAEDEIVPQFVPSPEDPRRGLRVMLLREERAVYRGLAGLSDDDVADDEDVADDVVTFDEDAPEDRECPYGKDEFELGSPRPIRDDPKRSFAFTIGAEGRRITAPLPKWQEELTQRGLRELAARLGCWPHQVGPCRDCAEPAALHGPRGYPTCRNCRSRAAA